MGLGVIIGIMALIAIVSLYEYFSSRSWQQVTSVERNEVVFANRNHEYGAYAIRKGYDMRLLLILGITVFTIGSSYAIYRIIQSLPEEVVEEPKLDLTQFSMNAPEIKEELDPPVEEEIPEMEKTVQFLPPVVVDEVVETHITVPDEKTPVSDEDREGKETFNEIKEVVKVEVVEEKEDNTVYAFVEEPAEFPGGTAAMMKYLADNIKYPQTAIELDIQGKCYLQFVVSKNGNISNVEVKRGVTDCKECDKEAERVVRAMPKWSPGKKGGKSVNSTFNLPVNFKLK